MRLVGNFPITQIRFQLKMAYLYYSENIYEY
jgi:hypothetical protein